MITDGLQEIDKKHISKVNKIIHKKYIKQGTRNRRFSFVSLKDDDSG